MREIKFRAWDKKDKRMIVGEQDFIPLLVTSKGMFRLNPHHQEPLWSLCEKERFELMQYTGLKDKNGREIYEGDICTAEQMLFPLTGTRTGIVKYHDASYLLEDLDGKDGDFLFSETAETTVIGNIYENPELIEV